MKKKDQLFEIGEVLLAIAIVVMTIILLVNQAAGRSVLYPIVFGLGTVLSALHSLDGILYNNRRVIRKGHVITFGILALLLAACTFFSIRAL